MGGGGCWTRADPDMEGKSPACVLGQAPLQTWEKSPQTELVFAVWLSLLTLVGIAYCKQATWLSQAFSPGCGSPEQELFYLPKKPRPQETTLCPGCSLFSAAEAELMFHCCFCCASRYGEVEMFFCFLFCFVLFPESALGLSHSRRELEL